MKENLKNNCVLFPPTDSNTLFYIHNSFQSLRKKANNFFSLSLLCENSHLQNFWITYLILTPCIFLYLINKISLIEENVKTIFLFLWRERHISLISVLITLRIFSRAVWKISRSFSWISFLMKFSLKTKS